MALARTNIRENWSFKAGESEILRTLMLGGRGRFCVDIDNGILKVPMKSDTAVCQFPLHAHLSLLFLLG